jgi:transglutaminase-like putative cysteine protease
MIYNITHRTTFKYSDNVSISQHLVHLMPRSHPRQSVYRQELIVEPAPTVMTKDTDYFGNATTYLTVEELHNKLVVNATSTVDIIPTQPPAPELTMPWDQVSILLSQASDDESLSAYQYAFDSPFTGSANAAAYAEPSFAPGRPILEAAVDLTSRIFRDFKYEGGVTDIYTPVDQVLFDKHGVCQDFAHLQIACLRGLNLPARYVSGYLMTHPPAGQKKLIGADESHAWLSIWIPNHGWVDLDPTNNLIPSDEHITVAWGRDYGDVSPINGLVLGGGEQVVDVSVDVRPVSGSDTVPSFNSGEVPT